MTQPHNLYGLSAVVGVLLLAAALRLHLLGAQNFNWDESYTHWLTGQPYTQMIETTARDVHPPLYYMLVRPLRMIEPDMRMLPRLLSAWAGIIAVALAYRLGVAVAGQREGVAVGVLAAGLLALSRAHIEISQLARMHALSVMFVTAMLWATLVFLRDGRGRRGAALVYVLSTLGALYSFYLAVIGPLATNAAFLVIWWRRGRPVALLLRWLGLQVVAAGVFGAWALYALPRMHGWYAGEPSGFLFFLQVYAVTLTTGISANWNPILPLALLALAVLALATAYLLWSRRDRFTRDSLSLLLVALLMPLPVVFVLTLPVHNLGRPLAVRYLLATLAAFPVLAAWGLVALGRVRPRVLGGMAGGLGAVLIGGAALFGLTSVYHTSVPQDDLASVGMHLAAHRFPDDGFVLHTDFDWRRVQIHHDGLRLDVPHLEPINEGFADGLLAPLWAESGAVWLLLTPDSQVNDPDAIIRRWFEERATAQREWTFNQNQLIVYARTPERAATLDDLAPDSYLRQLPADPLTGVIAVERPFDRYPVGDTLSLAVTWDDPPAGSVLVVACGDVRREIAVPPAPEPVSGPVRQQMSVLMTPDLPSGTCRLTLNGFVDLGTFTLLPAQDDYLVASIPADARAADIRFGDSIVLAAYTHTQAALSPGDRLDVTGYWRTDGLIDTRYKITVFLLGTAFNPATGNPLWAQVDAEPVNWLFPTTRWPVNTLIRDRYRLRLPDDTPPGTYTLGVVVYAAADGVRLPAFGPDDTPFADDIAVLRTVEVVE